MRKAVANTHPAITLGRLAFVHFLEEDTVAATRPHVTLENPVLPSLLEMGEVTAAVLSSMKPLGRPDPHVLSDSRCSRQQLSRASGVESREALILRSLAGSSPCNSGAGECCLGRCSCLVMIPSPCPDDWGGRRIRCRQGRAPAPDRGDRGGLPPR